MDVYLDNSATTMPYEEVTRKVTEMMTSFWGNPSALYAGGIKAEREIRRARQSVADLLGASADEIFFTSGGTESDNTAIFGVYEALRRSGAGIITTEVEHPAVLEAIKRLAERGADVTYLPVDGDCRISLADLEAAVTDDTVLISIMAVNNETGTVMPVADVAALKRNAYFHVDAVQAFGKLDISGTGADMMSVSAHKIHGPKGVGALLVKKGLRLMPFLYGGGQERGMRSGTENTSGIAGFGRACEIAGENFDVNAAAVSRLNAMLRQGLKDSISDIRINSPEDACPSVLNVSFLGTRGEVILHKLERDGIMVLTGSVCLFGKKGGSHVLKAMGLSRSEVESAVRFSFGTMNSEEEIEYTIDRTKAAVESFRCLGSFR